MHRRESEKKTEPSENFKYNPDFKLKLKYWIIPLWSVKMMYG